MPAAAPAAQVLEAVPVTAAPLTSSAALATVGPSALERGDLARAHAWTPDRIDLIKRTVCPTGITTDELALFIEQCRRSGLDPLTRQAFCVPRRKKISRKGERDEWITVHEFQPSEAGMLARAEEFADYRGTQAAAVYEGDELTIDAAAGSVSHVYKPVARKAGARLLGSWGRVLREGRPGYVVWLEVEAYRQQSPTWDKLPGTMIEKCARVAALRKAFPGPFGGLYIPEELPSEERAPAASSSNKGERQAEQSKPAAQELDAAKAPLLPVRFGPFKGTGKRVRDLTDKELREAWELGRKMVSEKPSEPWAAEVRTVVAACSLEGAARRDARAAEAKAAEEQRK